MSWERGTRDNHCGRGVEQLASFPGHFSSVLASGAEKVQPANSSTLIIARTVEQLTSLVPRPFLAKNLLGTRLLNHVPSPLLAVQPQLHALVSAELHIDCLQGFDLEECLSSEYVFSSVCVFSCAQWRESVRVASWKILNRCSVRPKPLPG